MIQIDAIIETNKFLTGHGDVLNKSMLESAFSSWHYFETPEDQICSVLRGIIKNHPFRDGNKRTAVIVFYEFIDLMNLNFTLSETKFEDIVVKIAESKFDVEEITKMLFENINEDAAASSDVAQGPGDKMGPMLHRGLPVFKIDKHDDFQNFNTGTKARFKRWHKLVSSPEVTEFARANAGKDFYINYQEMFIKVKRSKK